MVFICLHSISIHAPLVGSDSNIFNFWRYYYISIHAPLVGSDCVLGFLIKGRQYFNPRSPCGERHLTQLCFNHRKPFQSTLPLWGATSYNANGQYSLEFQSTLPLWGATRPRVNAGVLPVFQSTLPLWGATEKESQPYFKIAISIHAPLVGSDPVDRAFIIWIAQFQSTLPLWGATLCVVRSSLTAMNFNPRSPCGERRSVGYQF